MEPQRKFLQAIISKLYLIIPLLAFCALELWILQRLSLWYAGFNFEHARMVSYASPYPATSLLWLYILNHCIIFGLGYYILNFPGWSWLRPERFKVKGLAFLPLLLVNIIFIAGFFYTLNAPFVALTRRQTCIFTYHPYLTWQFVPSSGYQELQNGIFQVRINSFGFRGPEIKRVKPKDTVRIILLGDSAFYAIAVWQNETAGMLLGDYLKSRFPGKTLEVLNGCVPCTCMLQGLYLLKHRAIPLNPDIVIVGYNNDSQVGEPESPYPPAGTRLIEWLIFKSSFFRVVCEALSAEANNAASGRQSLLLKPGSRYLPYPEDNHRVTFADYQATITEMARLSREHHFKLIFLGMPEYLTADNTAGFVCLEPKYRYGNKKLARELGVGYFDAKALWGNKDPSLFIADNHHFTAKGNRKLARDIADFLITQGYLK